MLVQLSQSYVEALNKGQVPTIESAWENVQVTELQRSYDEAMTEFNQCVKNEFNSLPISEEVMKTMLQSYKDQAMATFRQGILSGSDFLSTPKGEEFLARLEKEQTVITSQIQLKNRKFLSKELFDVIQKQVDTEIKPKINAMLQKIGSASGAEPGTSVNSDANKYDFRDLKRDLENIHATHSETYPSELVYQKIFDVTFQMSELLMFVTRQVGQNAELFAIGRLK